MRRTTISVCAALLASIAVAQPYTGSVEIEQVEQDWYTNATMSMEDALEVAGELLEGAFTSAKLEIQHGYLVYGVNGIDEDGAPHHLVVDAGDGSVLVGLPDEAVEEEEPAEDEPEAVAADEEEPSEEETAEEPPRHPILDLDVDMLEAIAAALDEFSGYVLNCNLSQKGEDWVYTSLIADRDAETATIRIDAESGEEYEPED